MRVLREWIHRLRGTLQGVRRDADLEEELRLHMELAADEAHRRGETPQDAAGAARLRAGGVSQAMDALRDQRDLPWLDSIASDVVFGWRQLNKHRIASSAAILSLGLAFGASLAAAFRLVDAVLLRPLPVASPSGSSLPQPPFWTPGIDRIIRTISTIRRTASIRQPSATALT